MHFSCKYLKYSLTLVFEVIEFEDFLCFVNFWIIDQPKLCMLVTFSLYLAVCIAMLFCLYLFKLFLFNCLLKKNKKGKNSKHK